MTWVHHDLFYTILLDLVQLEDPFLDKGSLLIGQGSLLLDNLTVGVKSRLLELLAGTTGIWHALKTLIRAPRLSLKQRSCWLLNLFQASVARFIVTQMAFRVCDIIFLVRYILRFLNLWIKFSVLIIIAEALLQHLLINVLEEGLKVGSCPVFANSLLNLSGQVAAFCKLTGLEGYHDVIALILQKLKLIRPLIDTMDQSLAL